MLFIPAHISNAVGKFAYWTESWSGWFDIPLDTCLVHIGLRCRAQARRNQFRSGDYRMPLIGCGTEDEQCICYRELTTHIGASFLQNRQVCVSGVCSPSGCWVSSSLSADDWMLWSDISLYFVAMHWKLVATICYENLFWFHSTLTFQLKFSVRKYW